MITSTVLIARPGVHMSGLSQIFDTFYRGFFDARAQSIVLRPDADLSRYPVVVAPALYSADDATLDALAAYAERGGHLVVTLRTGYADEYARARWTRAPGRLRTAAGVGYNLYSTIDTPLTLSSDVLALPGDGLALGWADELVVEDQQTEVLATYVHPHFGRFPAITSHPYGAGRVTYVGSLPNAPLARSIADWVLRTSSVPILGDGLPEPVRVTSATTKDGRRLTFCSNWSFSDYTLKGLLNSGIELFSDVPVDVGQPVTLGPWDVKVIDEGPPPDNKTGSTR